MTTLKRYPPTHILSPRFKYVPAAQTNIAETFARVKAELSARDTAAVPIKRKGAR
jgi:hypothetical protein